MSNSLPQFLDQRDSAQSSPTPPAGTLPELNFYPGGYLPQDVQLIEETPDHQLNDSQRQEKYRRLGLPLPPPPPVQAIMIPPLFPRPPPPPPAPLVTRLQNPLASPAQLPSAFPPSAAISRVDLKPPGPGNLLEGVSKSSSHRRAFTTTLGYILMPPPVNIDITRNIEISVVEICTFFPDFLLISEVMVRLMRNGWTQRPLAILEQRAVNKATEEDVKTAYKLNSQRMRTFGMKKWNVNSWSISIAQEAGPENDLTAATWSNPGGPGRNHLGDYSLDKIYNRVPRQNWPQGADRLVITQCFEFAKANPWFDLDTSHIPWLIQTLGLRAPPAPVGQNRDQEALARLFPQS